MGWRITASDGLRFVIAVAAIAAAGCTPAGHGAAGPTPAASPVPKRICLEASPRLNWYGASAHTLTVRLMQLATPGGFDETDPDRLLDPQAKPAGILGVPIDRQIYPGTTTTVELLAQPRAAWIGIVAGYSRPTGPIKLTRRLADDESKGKTRPRSPGGECVQLGPEGIVTPAS